MPFNLVVNWGIHQEDGMANGSYFLLLFCSVTLWCPSYYGVYHIINYGIHHILSTPLLWSSGLSTGNQTVDWAGVLHHRLPSTSQVWTKLGWNHFLIDIAWRKYYSNAFLKHVCWNDLFVFNALQPINMIKKSFMLAWFVHILYVYEYVKFNRLKQL